MAEASESESIVDYEWQRYLVERAGGRSSGRSSGCNEPSNARYEFS
jgi:hypothetical protein